MSYLFYCICRNRGPDFSGVPLGVEGAPVYRVTHDYLSAAVSVVVRAEAAPDLSRLRTFEQVVVSLHQRRTVIPLRYGCLLERESQVIQVLEEGAPHYNGLLRELDGCVEMGLRVLLPSGPWTAVTPVGAGSGREAAGPPFPPSGATPARPGLTYLTARQAHYAHQDHWTEEYRQAADRCLAQFDGLFVKSRKEPPSPRLPLLSLYFLVPRPAVASFRQAFRRLAAREPARLLLSGPWPPYNFVTGGPRGGSHD